MKNDNRAFCNSFTVDQWQSFYDGITQTCKPRKNEQPFATHYAGKNRVYFFLNEKSQEFFKVLYNHDKNLAFCITFDMRNSWFAQGLGNGVFYTRDYGKIKIK